ncbi:Fe2+-enterobactin ABC transporter substrate-binding protein [Corynebacterium sp. 335C]
MTTLNRHRMRAILAAAGVAALAGGGLAACSDDTAGDAAATAASATEAAKDAADGSGESAESGSEEQSFPRTVETLDGKGEPTEVTIEAKPERVVSASVSLTGALLAVDAPVVATGGGGKGPIFTKEEGFGTSWADEAREEGVESLYRLEPSAEAILAQKPDLVVMSNVGQDKATDIYDQLAGVVPVVVIDYSDKSWLDVTKAVGEATGHAKEAEKAIADYEAAVKEAKDSITAPEQPVNLVSLPKEGVNFFTADSAQGRVLTDLGIEVAQPSKDLAGGTAQGKDRGDVVGVAPENVGVAFDGKSAFLLNLNGKTTPETLVKKFPELADAEAVKNDRVYELPGSLFRIDYFSAMEMVETLKGMMK